MHYAHIVSLLRLTLNIITRLQRKETEEKHEKTRYSSTYDIKSLSLLIISTSVSI